MPRYWCRSWKISFFWCLWKNQNTDECYQISCFGKYLNARNNIYIYCKCSEHMGKRGPPMQAVQYIPPAWFSLACCVLRLSITIKIPHTTFYWKVKVDPEKSVHEFIEKDLKIPPSRSSVIPREVQLSQVLSLYKRLTWHKAVIFVKQGHDPYKEALSSSKCHV